MKIIIFVLNAWRIRFWIGLMEPKLSFLVIILPQTKIKKIIIFVSSANVIKSKVVLGTKIMIFMIFVPATKKVNYIIFCYDNKII